MIFQFGILMQEDNQFRRRGQTLVWVSDHISYGAIFISSFSKLGLHLAFLLEKWSHCSWQDLAITFHNFWIVKRISMR